jgi:hypothetical protein
MQNSRKHTVMNARQPKLTASFAGRPKRWAPNANHPKPNRGSLQRSYERYLALGQEEARSGNVVGAENYYQHAEHYYVLEPRSDVENVACPTLQAGNTSSSEKLREPLYSVVLRGRAGRRRPQYSPRSLPHIGGYTGLGAELE